MNDRKFHEKFIINSILGISKNVLLIRVIRRKPRFANYTSLTR